ncbi:MAG: VOC family protein, partial [Parvibaculum sp.]
MSRFFGKVCQNGYVVRDIEAALKHWTEVLGVGPFYYIDRVKCDWFTYRGKPSPVEMSIALGNTGDLQIELIQQRNDAPSMYMDFLNAGREGLQHMSYWTTDYQAAYDRALAAGYKVGHEGQI